MKSSKKIFAILTLVAFLMTLVPMAAFAAPATYSAAASEVDATNTTLDVYADSDDLAKLTITFQDENGPVNAGDVTFYVKSDRDAELGYVQGDDTLVAATMASAAGQAVTATTTSTGKVYVYVGSKITGTAKISIYNALGAEDGLLIGSADIKVAIGDGAATLTMTNDDNFNDASIGTQGDPYQADVADDVELVATVKDGIKAVEGKEVKFQAKYEGGSFTTIATGLTDEDGIAKYYFAETKSGAYEYRVKYADENSNYVYVDYAPGAVTKLEAKTVEGTKIANKKASDIQFYVKDKYDNLIKSGAVVKFKVAAAPEDSSFVDDAYRAAIAPDANGVATLSFTPDKVGSYTIRIAKDTTPVRTYADVKVEALTFGDTTSMSFKLYNNAGKEVTTLARVSGNDAAGVEKNLAAGTLVTYLVDQNGVKVKAAVDAVDYASSDIASVTFGGTALDGVTPNAENAIVIKSGAKDVTLSVLDPESNVVGTYALNVVGSPASLKFTPVVTGKTAVVTMQYVDSTGENTYNVADETYSIVTPAKVSSATVKAFDATGKATFELNAEVGGQYAITVMTAGKKIVGTFTVDFAVDAAPVIGAKNVTMFIGAPGYTQDGAPKVSDVAPFIKDGRTFVAIRPVADAFGAEIGWNEATKTVTLTRSDVTVTIVIGSSAVTVVKGGVTSTVTADVAAFIKDGRTVLPFRAVGEAFGATVNFDAATQAVTYVQ